MAKDYPAWNKLNPKQRKLALARWHDRKDGDTKPAVDADARRQAYLSEEVVPGLTRGDLIKSTKAATQTKFGEAEQQLAHQPARTNSWFDQYQAAIRGAQAQQAQANAQAVQGVQNLQQGLDASAAQQWAGQQQQMADDAKLRGAQTDPQLADVAHNASNVRNALTGSYGAMLLGQGKAEDTYLANRGVNANVGRISALSQNAAARQALAKEKGAFRVQYRDQLKADQRKGNLESALTEYQQQQLMANTAETRQDIRTKKLENDYFAKYGKKPGTTLSPLEAYRLAYAKKHGYFPPSGPPKKDGGTKNDGKDKYGNTGLQQKTRTSDFRKVKRNADKLVERLRNSGAGAVPGVSTATSNAELANRVYDAIAADYGSVNIDILRGAIQKAVYGHVGKKVGNALDELGVSY